ncbi:putative glycoside hydrolase [Bacillus sp. DNRA2]|uniref:putative glycoside hydrolase n=1 Tax=Bacillus sp. DNRA2 TaxID=2723053 RepID=UPI00145CBFC6|nr:putative glycoside hydrolase [Bacillus sp. DNRA2]NMD68722.1 putative glycoside hydrolase [Bacillus sp. DNRA2]
MVPMNIQAQFEAATVEPVRGIYVQAANTKGPKFTQLLDLVKNTELNTMVIDIKDDYGHITFTPSQVSVYHPNSHPYITDPEKLMKTLKEHNIYPIARIVVFKDTVLAKKEPSYSFKKGEELWKNSRGDSFTNPFLKEVWDYNVGIAIEAAKMGFKEIQFDYVRFPEKFEQFESELTYYKPHSNSGQGQYRIDAVTDFVSFAKKKLEPYDVKMSVDTFGNTTVIEKAPGIGQDFSKIAKNIDVISSMIYPSHWSGIFGLEKPDLEPYKLVSEYARVEKEKLSKLKHPPQSRPWLQDFTAPWLGKGNYRIYGKTEVEDQIRALYDQGIHEYLLWNSKNVYTQGVDYTPY